MSGRRPPAAAVIDLFHTLVDPEDFRPKEFRRVAQIVSALQLEEEEFLRYWRGEEIAHKVQTTAAPITEFVSDYLATLGKTAELDVLKTIDHEYGRYQDEAILNPRPHVMPALKQLRDMGLKLALLSNTTQREVHVWSQSKLSPLFDAAVFSCDIGCMKPDAIAYKAALEKLGGVKPSDAAYIGDGADVIGAKEAGFGYVIFMRGFVAHNGLRTPEEITDLEQAADTVIDSLSELPDLLGKGRRS